MTNRDLFEDEEKFLFDEDEVMEEVEQPSTSAAVNIGVEDEHLFNDEDMMAFNQAITEELVLETVEEKPTASVKTAEKKKFQVKVPTKRRNLALPEPIGDHITTKRESQDRGKKKQWNPPAMTASGPFAMGPAKASGISQPSDGSSTSREAKQMTVSATSLKTAGRDGSSSTHGSKTSEPDAGSGMEDSSVHPSDIPFVEAEDEKDDDESVKDEMMLDDTPAAYKPHRLGTTVSTQAEEQSQVSF